MVKMPEYLHFHVVANAKGTEVVELQDASDHDWVDVVRCKDCVHYIAYRQDCGLYAWGKSNGLENPQPEDFCSRGGRREDT